MNLTSVLFGIAGVILCLVGVVKSFNDSVGWYSYTIFGLSSIIICLKCQQ